MATTPGFRPELRFFPLPNGHVLYQHIVEDLEYSAPELNPCLIDPALFDLTDVRVYPLVEFEPVLDPVTQVQWDAEFEVPTIDTALKTRLQDLKDILSVHLDTISKFETTIPAADETIKAGMIALREVLKSKVTL